MKSDKEKQCPYCGGKIEHKQDNLGEYDQCKICGKPYNESLGKTNPTDEI